MKDIVDRWLARLRDPNTQRVSFFLRKGDSFCAVGLLCDVIDPSLWEEGYGKYWYQNSYAAPPNKVESLFRPTWLNTIAIKSDRGMPFPELADYIEQTWKENLL